jgi:hypothetical protein
MHGNLQRVSVSNFLAVFYWDQNQNKMQKVQLETDVMILKMFSPKYLAVFCSKGLLVFAITLS